MSVKELKEKLLGDVDYTDIKNILAEFEQGIREKFKAVNKQCEYDNNEYYDGIYEGQTRILEDLLGDD